MSKKPTFSLTQIIRTTLVFLAWAWSIIGAAALINAIVKANNQKAAVRRAIPPPTRVFINDRALRVSGSMAIVAVLFLALITTVYLPSAIWISFDPDTYEIYGVFITVFALWLMGAMIAFTYYFATKSATVTAFVDGNPVGGDVVQRVQDALGITNVYHRIHYLRLAVILPWIAFLFAVLAAAALFVKKRHPRTPKATNASQNITEKKEVKAVGPPDPLHPNQGPFEPLTSNEA